MRLFICVVTAVGYLFAAEDGPKENVTISAGIVLPQIVAGGAWSTDIQVMHAGTQDLPIGFNLRFFDDDGLPLNIPIDGIGTFPGVQSVVQARGQRIIRLSGGDVTLSGYAVVEFSGQPVVLNAVLTQKVEGRPDFQASIPGLSPLMKDVQFPFRNDGPYTTTLAVVGATDQNVLSIARDDDGLELCRYAYFAGADSHASAVLTDILPCTDGVTGTVQLTVDGGGGALIAFLFNDAGAFTTQIPYEITGR